MGGDGQALSNKRSLLQKSRAFVTETELQKSDTAEKQTTKARTIERWSHCAISLQPLEFPAAFDSAGTIFSKQAVVDYLLERKEAGDDDAAAKSTKVHVSKLSDVREIANDIESKGAICCPITGYSTTSGIHAFVGFWGCGHVICSTALKKRDCLISQVGVECPFCGQESFYVRLALDSDEDAEEQYKFFRSHVKKSRKRNREEAKE